MPGLLYKINLLIPNTIHFLTFVWQYLNCRIIHPSFYNTIGKNFEPKSGISQGSCLGPVLFSIFVNDHPNPVNKNNIYQQFADDLIAIITSKFRIRNRKRASKFLISQFNIENQNIRKWEENWRIQSNPDKTKALMINCNKNTLKIGNQLKDGDCIVVPDNYITILGYDFDKNNKKQVTKNIGKAKTNLTKIESFKNAPMKIRKILYKSLVRSVLEYPLYPLNFINKTNMRKIQMVQNRGVRYINNVTLLDKKRTTVLHDKIKMEPMNIRINQLANKIHKTMKNTYMSKKKLFPPIYKLDLDYEIKDEPIRKRRKTQAMKINEYINIYSNYFLNKKFKTINNPIYK